jgi:hypothetical protein
MAGDGRCGQVQANLSTFEAAASMGYVTANRMRDWGSANGFFPVVRGAIHQLLSIILKLRILVLLPVSTMPYVVMVKNYS